MSTRQRNVIHTHRNDSAARKQSAGRGYKAWGCEVEAGSPLGEQVDLPVRADGYSICL